MNDDRDIRVSLEIIVDGDNLAAAKVTQAFSKINEIDRQQTSKQKAEFDRRLENERNYERDRNALSEQQAARRVAFGERMAERNRNVQSLGESSRDTASAKRSFDSLLQAQSRFHQDHLQSVQAHQRAFSNILESGAKVRGDIHAREAEAYKLRMDEMLARARYTFASQARIGLGGSSYAIPPLPPLAPPSPARLALPAYYGERGFTMNGSPFATGPTQYSSPFPAPRPALGFGPSGISSAGTPFDSTLFANAFWSAWQQKFAGSNRLSHR